ncbi:hypothetical protein AJ80_06964 [Polytolypa hystricis UAMH7299]|uniref:Heterokaryon incompatibility domain-containing protein n=1 Tax=Polytolypa hystricis (strain UAMH7299) TaxID=1447883 RepID=A0A2B7XRF2_POLH7|nr:hypothetical protein AJ80_06964 [Polytolypa hystricis UAMH7299]
MASKSPMKTGQNSKAPLEIRLLRLSPSRKDGLVHVNFESILLDPTFRRMGYDALSFTWADESGDCSMRFPVYIGPYWDISFVTRNCQQALQCAQHKNRKRLIWVDSLCIHQENLVEKGAQTRFLHAIYQRASWVVVYLGVASADSGIALDLLRKIAPQSARRRPNAMVSIDQASQNALQSLFQRPFFTRLWAVQEVLVARRLEILCGSSTVRMNQPFIPNSASLSISVPLVLSDRRSQNPLSYQSLLDLLLRFAAYECSDPRDKIFAVPAHRLHSAPKPNYRLPVRHVYILATQYICNELSDLDVITIAGMANRTLDIPSWVPDWSRHLIWRFPEDLFVPDLKDSSNVLYLADRLIVETPILKWEVDTTTEVLEVKAVKMCDISGTITRHDHGTSIIMVLGKLGNLIICLLDRTYEIGDDSIFLLKGCTRPVILRPHSKDGFYVFVSVCSLYIGPPPIEIEWCPPHPTSSSNQVKVPLFSEEEIEDVVGWNGRLNEICFDEDLSYVGDWCTPKISKVKVTAFSQFSATNIDMVEGALWDRWKEMKLNIGWMFLDQTALWLFLQHLIKENQEQNFGKSTIPFEELEKHGFNDCSITKFPETYKWDVCRLCWSFLKSPVPVLGASESAWNPMLDVMKKELNGIREWAKVTEQLMAVLEYMRLLLGEDWPDFPGSHRQEQWLSKWEIFCDTIELPEPQPQTKNNRETHGKQEESDCFWSWGEFEKCMGLRAMILDEEPPAWIDPRNSFNVDMGARIAMRFIGLELYDYKTINLL